MTEPNCHVPSPRTRITREPQLAIYDREVVYRILDEGLVCHVGFTMDDQPYVIPTAYGRVGDNLYIHGSVVSRMLHHAKAGFPVCVTVTLLDGLVLARSVFNHSMNYRSVVVLGTSIAVEDPQEKIEALRALSEHILSGRWADARHPNEKELKATLVIRIPITEFSAKVRTGPPVDDSEDYSLGVWAGVIPLEMVAREPVSDPRLDPKCGIPAYALDYRRNRRDQ